MTKFQVAGDSASLWNFTPAPGWTEEEVKVLRLANMKYGVGCWQKMLTDNIIPGKTLAQLNLQTQRLLGQQSTSEFMGLCIDIDRVRQKNHEKVGVKRKNNTVVNSGNNVTREELKAKQEFNKKEYGLSQEEIDAIIIPKLKAEETTFFQTAVKTEKLKEITELRKRLELVQKALARKAGISIEEDDHNLVMPARIQHVEVSKISSAKRKATSSNSSKKAAKVNNKPKPKTQKDEEIIQCVCGKDNESDNMICCDLCGIWCHMECVKVDPHKVPDIWACTDCTQQQEAAAKQSSKTMRL